MRTSALFSDRCRWYDKDSWEKVNNCFNTSSKKCRQLNPNWNFGEKISVYAQKKVIRLQRLTNIKSACVSLKSFNLASYFAKGPKKEFFRNTTITTTKHWRQNCHYLTKQASFHQCLRQCTDDFVWRKHRQ